MGSISIGIVRVQTMVGRVVAIEDAGKQIVRWGLIVVLAWIGRMKFTAYEAMGIQPLVAHSPLVGWMYHSFYARRLGSICRRLSRNDGKGRPSDEGLRAPRCVL